MAIIKWRASFCHRLQSRKPHPQIHLPLVCNARPHTTQSEKARRMKWVRLLQLSQTLGVNDIITAFWKYKPAYALLLPLQRSQCSINHQKLSSLSLSYLNNTAGVCQNWPLFPKAPIASHWCVFSLTKTRAWQWAESCWGTENTSEWPGLI